MAFVEVEAQLGDRAHFLVGSITLQQQSWERKKSQPSNSTMATTFPDIVIPGQPLAPVASYTPGAGVHIFNDQICASVVGQPKLSTPASLPAPPARKEKDQEAKQILSVLRPMHVVGGGSEDIALTNLLPQVGSTVLARVTRINPRQATVEIFVVGDTVSNDEFQGIIR